jgi:hypothetical protein
MPKFNTVASGLASSMHQRPGAAKIYRCGTKIRTGLRGSAPALTTRQPAVR